MDSISREEKPIVYIDEIHNIVGAGAVNQAVKAIAISRGFLSPIGIEIACVPSFADIVIDGEYRTAIRFTVDPRYTRGVAQPLGDDAHRPVPEIR